MIELIHDVLQWYEEGWDPIAVAVLIDIDGSAVRGVGAAMAVREDGLITGSVSGGCIESTVIKTAERVFKTGKAEVLSFCQIDDEILGSVSPCGGEVTIAVSILDKAFFKSFCALTEIGRGGRWGIITSGPQHTIGIMFSIDSNGILLKESFKEGEGLPKNSALNVVEACSAKNRTGMLTVGEYSIFSAVLQPVRQLIIVGASHIGVALQTIAELTGYRVTVIDPRSTFTREERFKNTVRLFKAWPRKAYREIDFTSHTAVAIITHDSKIDDQALELALQTKSFYIGALGSRSTQKDRIKRLSNKGVSNTEISRIHSPIGLSIQAANPEEIALSIMAEIVQDYRDKYGKDT